MMEDDILRIANEARLTEPDLGDWMVDYGNSKCSILKFTQLVIASEREALAAKIRSAIQAGRYHFTDPAKRDVSDRVLMDLLDEVTKAPSSEAHG